MKNITWEKCSRADHEGVQKKKKKKQKTKEHDQLEEKKQKTKEHDQLEDS